MFLLSLETSFGISCKMTHVRAHLQGQLLLECTLSEQSSKLHTGLCPMAFPTLQSSSHLPWQALVSKSFVSEVNKICEFLLCVISIFFNFYWCMVTLQQYVSFCCATKWISYMYTYIPSLLDLPSTLHPTPLSDYRAWSWASCAIQQLPTSCLFYTWWCICVSPNLPIHLISYLLLPYPQVYSVCAWDFNSHQDFGFHQQ